ncbi:MAG TPA: 5'-3' exonuclease H3TH domain-containing protein [Candidatus Dormibacteraeota bacterium]|nr:5'-3' exonuclease H3TH domain-containing protein [Candidatus Dormibacteraeota bacterium]
MRPNWLLVDGSSAIFRAFYGVPQAFRAPDGFLVNAVRGTLDRLASVVTERKPQHVALTTDEDWRPDWRVQAIPGYKEHRVAEPVPPLLIPQMPVIIEALAAVGFDVVGKKDYEAEDIIASLVEKVNKPVEIWSGDRDLFSLVRDSDVVVLYPEKAGLAVVDEAEVQRRYGVSGRAYADFAILRGDPSDGLPGVAGVGPKKAADLVKRYGSIQGMLDAGVFRNADAAYLQQARKVVPPVTTLDLEVPPGRRDRYPAHPAKVAEMGRRYGVASSFERLVNALTKI